MALACRHIIWFVSEHLRHIEKEMREGDVAAIEFYVAKIDGCVPDVERSPSLIIENQF